MYLAFGIVLFSAVSTVTTSADSVGLPFNGRIQRCNSGPTTLDVSGCAGSLYLQSPWNYYDDVSVVRGIYVTCQFAGSISYSISDYVYGSGETSVSDDILCSYANTCNAPVYTVTCTAVGDVHPVLLNYVPNGGWIAIYSENYESDPFTATMIVQKVQDTVYPCEFELEDGDCVG